MTIENIISPELIRRQAAVPIDDFLRTEEEIRLLSVGRFSDAKNFENVPAICRIIREKGFPVRWFLIGYGGDENLIRKQIIKEGMKDYVILLGKKTNPYPYMAACDFYIQPSRYEGKCVSVIEAQILHKPVVITRYATSASQLREGIDGFIVDMDNEGCANGIMKLISNKTLQEKLVFHTWGYDYSNRDQIRKVYAMVDD